MTPCHDPTSAGPGRRRQWRLPERLELSCLTPGTAPTIRGLAELEPATLAIMHGSSGAADPAGALAAIADDNERRLVQAG